MTRPTQPDWKRILTALSIALAWTGVNQIPAFAACGGGVVHDAVGGQENDVASATRIGDRSDVLVPNFNSNQDHTWRAVGLISNQNNFLEAGWVLRVDIFGNQSKHPYKTWVNLGHVHQAIVVDVTFAEGSTHEFKVHDVNGDQSWSFAYDGNAMGNQSMAMTQGLPVTEAERFCTADSLKADFDHLNKINCVNCNFTAYESLHRYVNTTNNWLYCERSNTHYEVLKTC